MTEGTFDADSGWAYEASLTGIPVKPLRAEHEIYAEMRRVREFIEINEAYDERTFEAESELEELWMSLRDLERELGLVLA